MARTTDKTKPYLRYGVILALIFGVRAFEASTSGAAWRARAYDSSLWFWSVVITAFVVCSLVTNSTRKHFAPAITVLLSVLAGATATLVVSSIPGMIIGLVVGVALAFDGSRRVSAWTLKRLLWHGLPAAIVGLSTGFLGSLTLLIRVDRAEQNRMAILVVAFLFGVALLWSFVVARRKGQRVATALLSATLFFAVAVIVEPWGVELDSRRRIRSLEPDIYTYSIAPVPLGLQNLVRGWRGATQVGTDRGLGAEEGESLQAFRNIDTVWLGEDQKPFASVGFSKMKLDSVSQLFAHRSGFNDEALLAFKNSSELTQLHLRSTKVTDLGLTALAGMPKLVQLDLSNTEINGSGLEQLNRLAPLNVIRLENTKTDDRTLGHLREFQVGSLVLRGTQVQGQGLKQLDKTKLYHLDLSHSRFREEFIDDIVSAPLSTVLLDGIKLTEVGIRKLASISFLDTLSIMGSEVDDECVKPLKGKKKLNLLMVDATNLSPASCDSLAHITTTELHYDAKTADLEKIRSHYAAMRSTLMQLKKERRIIMPPEGGPAVTIVIHNLIVDYPMVQELKKLGPCRLDSVRIQDPDAEIHSGLEPDDLNRYFHKGRPIPQ